MDLEILRKANSIEQINAEEIYEKYIANDLCFNYPGLFSSIAYSIPKGDGGVRQLHFLEPRLWILYYALGFYFLELTDTIRGALKPIQKRASIYTYYGANIRADCPHKSQIHYLKDYKDFRKGIREAIRTQIQDGKVAILHLDIQDFFSSIDHNYLMQILAKQASPALRIKLAYDEDTKFTIREILFLIMSRLEGLPMSPQNIVSNLLSHLFLYPLDCFIREIQMENPSSLTFHRYVDDMFITVKFPNTSKNEEIGTKMLEISNRIGEFLASNLALSLNPLKTSLDILASEDEVENWIESSSQLLQPFARKPNKIASRGSE